MAIKYLRSTDGDDLSDGSSWANAYATLAYAASQMAAGDTLYVSQAHSEVSTGSAITVTFPGTNDSPNLILCVNDAAEPPTTLATGANFEIQSPNNWTIIGCFYMYGCTIKIGTATSSASNINLATNGTSTPEIQRYEECEFWISTTGTSGRLNMGVSSTVVINKFVHWKNCRIRFANAAHAMNIRRAPLYWEGGGTVSGTSTPTSNGMIIGDNAYAELTGVDLSNFGSTLPLAAQDPIDIVLRNCKLPASWTGNLVVGGAIFGGSGRVSLYNTDNADTNYRSKVRDYCGDINDETTIVQTGGASDGVTPISWRMDAASRCAFPMNFLRSPEIAIWNDTAGSSKTVTVEILHDSTTALTNADIWLEVIAMTTSGLPLGAVVDNRKALLASASNHATSTTTWTTTGLTNPNKQKLEVTFTPQEKGFFIARVCVAKASYTVYVDPKLTVT